MSDVSLDQLTRENQTLKARLKGIVQHCEQLEQKVAEMKRRFKDGTIPLPDFWGGYRVVPERIEFWQGRPSRLHDRLNYRHVAGTWQRERLAP